MLRLLLPLLFMFSWVGQQSYAQCAGASILNIENFDSGTSGTWTAFDATGDDSWLFNGNEAAMNGFGGSADEDWLISPPLDFSATVNPVANFDYSERYSGPDLVFKYSTNYSGSGDPNLATWTTLLVLTEQTAMSSLPPYINANVNLSAITSSTVYFAFHYTTNGSGAGDTEDWRVDNICISADSGGAPPTCMDGIQNGNETGTDCGGPDCPACPTCTDGMQNGNETGVDCGGDCAPCSVGAYYDGIETMIQSGTECVNLKTALHNLIKGHTVIPYSSSSTYDVRQFICDYDTRLNDAGTTTIIWDVYSDNPTGAEPYEYVCGPLTTNTSAEALGYNREHVLPKSWWGGSTSVPQHTDLNNILPSDGHVNQQKSNHGMGETSNPTFTSMNGTKVGPPDNGCGGALVFEPLDEYKGDFARMRLYMAVRYEDVIASWEPNSANSMAALDGNSYTVYETCYRTMLLDWHENDPVSAKEIARNDAIYSIQGNRNPFIDHPEYAAYIWGDAMGTACSDAAPRFLAPKVYLQGPLSGATMLTQIAANGSLPPTEPYTALGFAGLQNVSASLAASATANTGNDAIVDWVVVSLRTGATPATATTVVASRAALLQADGDVVDVDGNSFVGFTNISAGNYYISIHHRNHLGVMTNTTYAVN